MPTFHAFYRLPVLSPATRMHVELAWLADALRHCTVGAKRQLRMAATYMDAEWDVAQARVWP